MYLLIVFFGSLWLAEAILTFKIHPKRNRPNIKHAQEDANSAVLEVTGESL